MASILLISNDKDLSAVVAEQLLEQLSLTCDVVADNDAAAKRINAETRAIITEGASDIGAKLPVIKRARAPLRLQELLAEVEAALQKPASEKIAIGKFYTLMLRQKKLLHIASKKTTDVTDKEMQLLQNLIEAGNAGVGKEQLLKQVWGFESALNTHTLETHIYRLRGKFRDLSGDETIVASDGGYRLEA